jgi:hypothetical protein
MKKILFATLIGLIAVSCNPTEKTSEDQPSEEEKAVEIIEHNPELQTMHDEDQADRRPESGEIDWDVVLVRDSIRLSKAYEIVESNKISTSVDYYNLAIIFQHGYDTVASGMAVQMMEKAIELDSTINKWLLAAAIDRDLQRRGKPQIFGIQFSKNENGTWELYEIDTTKVSDAKRKEYGVASLAELKAEAAKMNK